jgi:two-component system, LytTR family, response regulator
MNHIALGGYQKALPETILYLQAEINYTHIHFVDGTVIKVAYTLKRLETRFIDFPKFFRCNRSFLVNMAYMHSFNSEKFEIQMINGLEISVSRRRRPKFIKLFKIKKQSKKMI